MKILVTGASGFIGSYIVPALKEHELILLSRNPEKLDRFKSKKLKFVLERSKKLQKGKNQKLLLVNSVNGFQGKEKEVIISSVRSNDEGENCKNLKSLRTPYY